MSRMSISMGAGRFIRRNVRRVALPGRTRAGEARKGRLRPQDGAACPPRTKSSQRGRMSGRRPGRGVSGPPRHTRRSERRGPEGEEVEATGGVREGRATLRSTRKPGLDRSRSPMDSGSIRSRLASTTGIKSSGRERPREGRRGRHAEGLPNERSQPKALNAPSRTTAGDQREDQDERTPGTQQRSGDALLHRARSLEPGSSATGLARSSPAARA